MTVLGLVLLCLMWPLALPVLVVLGVIETKQRKGHKHD